MERSFDRSKAIKLLINQAKTLEKSVIRSLSDTITEPHARYVNFKDYADMFNSIARQVEDVLEFPQNTFPAFLTGAMKSYLDTLWGTQKQIVEAVALHTGTLLTYLESAIDFVEDEFDNISNFIRSKLRASIFTLPEKEIEIHDSYSMVNALGSYWKKGQGELGRGWIEDHFSKMGGEYIRFARKCYEAAQIIENSDDEWEINKAYWNLLYYLEPNMDRFFWFEPKEDGTNAYTCEEVGVYFFLTPLKNNKGTVPETIEKLIQSGLLEKYLGEYLGDTKRQRMATELLTRYRMGEKEKTAVRRCTF